MHCRVVALSFGVVVFRGFSQHFCDLSQLGAWSQQCTFVDQVSPLFSDASVRTFTARKTRRLSSCYTARFLGSSLLSASRADAPFPALGTFWACLSFKATFCCSCCCLILVTCLYGPTVLTLLHDYSTEVAEEKP